jgi:hypothetical protein
VRREARAEPMWHYEPPPRDMQFVIDEILDAPLPWGPA